MRTHTSEKYNPAILILIHFQYYSDTISGSVIDDNSCKHCVLNKPGLHKTSHN